MLFAVENLLAMGMETETCYKSTISAGVACEKWPKWHLLSEEISFLAKLRVD